MFQREIYQARREALCGQLSQGVILLPGNGEASANYPSNTFRFRQDSTFLYFFGLNRPDCVGWIDVETREAWLFGAEYTVDDQVWMGVQPTLQAQAVAVGVVHTGSLDQLERMLSEARHLRRTVHFLPPYRGEITLRQCRWLQCAPEALSAQVSVPLARAVVALREVKAAEEIEQIEQACATAGRMHRRAMALCRPGVKEQEIMAALEAEALRDGAGVSFLSIVSQHGETLHNHRYDGILESGRLLLVDAGAEGPMNYCSDFTRTFPVNGRFTTRQREVYEVVRAANARTFELATPGVCYYEMHNAAARVIAEGLKSLGLMQGDMDEAVAVGAQALFMPHGLGHQMGLDVHDMENIGEKYVGYDAQTLRSDTPGLSALRMGKRMRPGMVITVEPGLYFIPALIAQWRRERLDRGFVNYARVEEFLDFGGIRVEDDMLITAEGNRLLGSDRPPVTPAQIEAYMQA
ncbi:MAG: aminopeptidase P family protein [Alistipes sp.]|nr:aminopeptidase P family protein [Alistipes sp.]